MRMFLGGSKGFSLYEDGDVTQASTQRVLCLVRTAEGGVLAGTAGGQVLAWSGAGDARVLATASAATQASESPRCAYTSALTAASQHATLGLWPVNCCASCKRGNASRG